MEKLSKSADTGIEICDVAAKSLKGLCFVVQGTTLS